MFERLPGSLATSFSGLIINIIGMGASLAMSSGRYGIITGRINRSNADPLILVSFPYASPDGYTMEYESASGEMHHTANSKGTVDEKGMNLINKIIFYVFEIILFAIDGIFMVFRSPSENGWR